MKKNEIIPKYQQDNSIPPPSYNSEI
jgi:hypothetical protein